jgi:hypothetical protein
MTDLHNRNSDRRSPYKGNGFSEKNSKQAEDTSPLLANRQLSRDSVASNNSSLGTDNPCLELDSSCEKLENVTASGDFRGNLAEEYTGLDLGLVTILF